MNLNALRLLILRAVRRPSPGRLKALGALCILVALGSWALASPVGASPDENFHLASIWCGQGIREGICEPGTTAGTRTVPSELMNAPCYAYQPDESAACQASQENSGTIITDRGNFGGLYPPVFYYVQSYFVGGDVATSVILMRAFNTALFVGLFAAIYLLLSTRLRLAMLGGALLTAVPLGVFLVPSINPSAWGILAATTILVSVVGYITTEDRRRRLTLGALAALALLIGAGARADAAMFAVVALAAAVILTVRRNVRDNRRLIYPAVLAVIAVLSFLSAGQSSFADPDASTRSFSFGRLMRTALDVPSLWIGGMGAPSPISDFQQGWPWGLGWLDTAMPGVVWVGLWGVYAAVLFIAVTGADRRRALAVSAVGLAAIVVPAYVQYLSDTPVGGVIQPRYVLPLLTILAATAMIRLEGTEFRLTRGQRWIVVSVLCLANAAALYANLRRYVTGNDGLSWNLDRTAEWWWSIPISPLTVFAVGALAFSAGVVILTREFTTASVTLDVSAPLVVEDEPDLDRLSPPVVRQSSTGHQP